MEKRFYLGAGLLAVILAISLWMTITTGNFHEPLAQQLQQASEVALSGDLPEGKNQMEQVKVQWESRWERTAAVADHSAMDEIDSLFAQTATYAQAGREAEFAAHCDRLSELLQAMADAQRLQWWNIL